MPVRDGIPGIPDPPSSLPSDVRTYLSTIAEVLRVRAGQSENQLDRSPTVRELFGNGVVSLIGTAPVPVGSPGSSSPFSDFYPYDAPPTPLNPKAVGLFTAIILTYDGFLPSEVTAVEVHRGTTNNINAATLRGISNSYQFVDVVGNVPTEYFYWIRTRIDRNGVSFLSPFTEVVSATVEITAADLLASLEQAISETHLATLLAARIDLVDAPGTGLVSGLAAEVSARVAAVTAEANARTAAIVAEAGDRVAADSALGAQITALAGEIIGSVYATAAKPLPGVGATPNPIADNARWYDSDDDNRPYIWQPFELTGTEWVQSAADTDEWYLRAVGGGAPPGITTPDAVYWSATLRTVGTVGALVAGRWGWGNIDSLGFNTVYAFGNQSANSPELFRWEPIDDPRIAQALAAIDALEVRINDTGSGRDIEAVAAALAIAEAVVLSQGGTLTTHAGRLNTLETNVNHGVTGLSATNTIANAAKTRLDNTGAGGGNLSVESLATSHAGLNAAVGHGVTGLVAAHTKANAAKARLDNTGAGLSIETVAGDTAATKAAVNHGTTGLAATTSRVTAAESRLNNTGGGKSIEVVASDLLLLQSDVIDAESGVAANATAISGLNTSVTNAQNTANSASNAATAASNAVTALTASTALALAREVEAATDGDNLVADPQFVLSRDRGLASGNGIFLTVESGWVINPTAAEGGGPAVAFNANGSTRALYWDTPRGFWVHSSQKLFLRARVRFASNFVSAPDCVHLGIWTTPEANATSPNYNTRLAVSASNLGSWQTIEAELPFTFLAPGHRYARPFINVRFAATSGLFEVSSFEIRRTAFGADVTANASAFTALKARVDNTGNGDSIEALADKVDELRVDVDATDVSLSGVATNLASVTGRVNNVDGGGRTIEVLASDVSTLSGVIFHPFTGFSVLSSVVAGHSSTLATVGNITTGLQTSIDALADSIDTINLELDGVETDVGLVASDVTLLNFRLDNLPANGGGFGRTIETLASDSSLLSSSVNDGVLGLATTRNRVGTVEGRINNTGNGTIEALASDVVALKASVNNGVTGLTATYSKATTVEARLNGSVSGTSFEGMALSVENLAVSDGFHSGAISSLNQIVFNATTGMTALHGVKLDVNGYVSSFGLFNNGLTSGAQFRVDTFSIGQPGVSGLSFVVDGGLVVMNGARIQNASITNAKIVDLAAEKLTTIQANIATAIIGTGHITNLMIGNTIQSANWNGTTFAGWQLDKTLGLFRGQGIEIRDGSGKLVLGSATGYKLPGEMLFYDSCDDASKWQFVLGSNNSITVHQPVDVFHTGGGVLRLGDGVSATTAGFASKSMIPAPGPNEMYRVRFRLRISAGVSIRAYAGIVGFAADGVTRVNRFGGNSHDLFHEVCGSNATYTTGVGQDFVEWTGFILGRSQSPLASANSGTFGTRTPSSPAQLHSAVRFISPIIHTNFNSGAVGQTEMDLVSIERWDYINGSNASTYIEALAVGTLQIANNAVLVPSYDSFTGSLVPSSSWQVVVDGQVTIANVSTARIVCQVTLRQNGQTSNPPNSDYRIMRGDGVVVWENLNVDNIQNYISLVHSEVVAVGTYTYQFQIKNTTGSQSGTVRSAEMLLFGAQK